ncbi:MAG: hypothetical protein H6Q48_5131 [Deltaproteobacteria bacterium]|nr:hypothetical protein [Deltaproteobacteria bacterium]
MVLLRPLRLCGADLILTRMAFCPLLSAFYPNRYALCAMLFAA